MHITTVSDGDNQDTGGGIFRPDMMNTHVSKANSTYQILSGIDVFKDRKNSICNYTPN